MEGRAAARNAQRTKGFSLVEAVLSSFLLLTAVAMSVWILDASLRAEAENDRRITAGLVAQNRLEEVRSWADLNFGDGLSTFHEQTVHTQGLDVTTYVKRVTLYTPCSRLEGQYPAAAVFPNPGPKALEKSCFAVEARVSWGPRPADAVSLVTYIGDTRPADFTVSIQPGAAQTVAAKETVQFTAKGVDKNGNRLDDLVYTWYVNPLDGAGTISEVSRDGQLCLYKNHFRNFDGRYTVQPGKCVVEVRAVYRGLEKTDSVEVTNEK